MSQYTYRCVVLPDPMGGCDSEGNPITSQCTYRCVVLPDEALAGAACQALWGLNAPTGAWCSLTVRDDEGRVIGCVSMHLQVRGAP